MKKLFLITICFCATIAKGQNTDDIITDEDRRLASLYDLRTPCDGRPTAKAWAKINKIEYLEKKRLSDSLKAVESIEKNRQRDIEEKKYWASKLKDLTKQFGSANARKLVDGKIWLGMTDKMMTSMYGEPTSVSKTTTKGQTFVTCYYEYGSYYLNPPVPILTFSNHTLVSFTE